MIYRAKKDWWLATLLLVNGLVTIGFGIALPFLDAGGQGPPNPAEPIPAPLAGLLVVGIGVVPLWMFFSAAYEIAPPDLVVRLGPFRLAGSRGQHLDLSGFVEGQALLG